MATTTLAHRSRPEAGLLLSSYTDKSAVSAEPRLQAASSPVEAIEQRQAVVQAMRQIADLIEFERDDLEEDEAREEAEHWRRGALRVEKCGEGKMRSLLTCTDPACGSAQLGDPLRCHLKVCEVCSIRAAAQELQRIREVFESQKGIPRVMHLTLPDYPRGHGQLMQLDLQSTWLRFRRSKEFERHVRGGIRVVESKIGKNSDEWHVHLHVIYWGSYWAQEEMAALWVRCASRRQYSVKTVNPATQWVQKVKGGCGAIGGYLSKYLTDGSKGVGVDWSDAGLVEEFVEMTYGARALRTFGSCYRLAHEAEEPYAETCNACGARAVAVRPYMTRYQLLAADALELERERSPPCAVAS